MRTCSRWSRAGPATWRSWARHGGPSRSAMSGPARRAPAAGLAASDVPDVLGPGLDVVFCGINPGFVSAAAAAHFANPRNDFWRLLHEAGFTPRLLAPDEQFEALDYGIGLTNAAPRTTRGSGDLRRGDFAGAAERLERLAPELLPGGSRSSARRPTAARSASGRARAAGTAPGRRGFSSCRPPRLRMRPYPGTSACAGSASCGSSSASAVASRASGW